MNPSEPAAAWRPTGELQAGGVTAQVEVEQGVTLAREAVKLYSTSKGAAASARVQRQQ